MKAWCTENGSEAASIGVQVHGGMGYIEEAGAAQYMRDAKIAEIYEGANGIQANDLIGRKVARDGGATAKAMIETMRALDPTLSEGGVELAMLHMSLSEGLGSLNRATGWLLANPGSDAAAGAMPYLRLWGVVAGGWLMARAALAAKADLDAGEGNASFLREKIITARFYGERILPRAGAYEREVMAGSDTLMVMADEAF